MPAGINFITDQSISFEHGAYLEQSKENPTTMNPLYELVPISEKPEHSGPVHALILYPSINDLQASSITHAAFPIDPETLKARIREELGKAFTAGQQHQYQGEHGGFYQPDCETYINSVIDNLFKQ